MYRHCFTLVVILFFCLSINASVISGSSTISLSGPASEQQIQTARQGARAQLKKKLVEWVSENSSSQKLDTLNALHNLFLESFVDSCLNLTKEESFYQGKSLTVTYNVTQETAEQAAKTYNEQLDSKAFLFWSAAKNAAQENNPVQFYKSAIQALSYASARIGSPAILPDDGGKILVDVIRDTLQIFLDKITFKSSNMILDGRAGKPVNNPPSITVTYDSTPLPGIGLTALYQNGKVLFSTVTNEEGKMSFDGLKIPFVANGTLISVKHNPGRIIDENIFVSTKDLGLRLKNSGDQTFIFKLSRPTYSLEYKASSVSQITLPPDFAGDSHLKKFLNDSCHMQAVKSGTQADLAIFVQNQVSNYNYDETEEVGVKLTAQITVKGLTLEPPKTEQEQLIYEKRYENRNDIPYGLFFWEANQKLREAIKNTMNRL